MKILQIVEPLQAGAGRHVVDLALGLSSRGHDVHVLYSPFRVDEVLERELIADRRVAVRKIEMQRAPDPTDLTAIARTLAYLHRNGPFDVIHAHSSKAGVIGRIVATATAAAVVYTPHAFATMAVDEFTPRRRMLYRLVERTLAAVTDTLLCLGPAEFEHARDVVGIPKRRIKVIANGLNPVGFRREADLHAELGLAPDARLIGAVGRLNIQKGIDLAVRAIGVLHQALGPEGADVRLVVLGDGDEKASLRRLAIDCGVENAVFWLGSRPAREYFHCFHLLFAPSRYEAAPYTPMEALFSGVPVVGTRSGSGDAVMHGINGFVVHPEDPGALAAAAIQILSQPGLHKRFSAAARQTATSFSPEIMVQAIEDAYLGHQSAKRRGSLADAVPQWRAQARAGTAGGISSESNIGTGFFREAPRDVDN
jgi:glycosyltransferase involved in cell wall biosynthesis